jgi:hypothetical protein
MTACIKKIIPFHIAPFHMKWIDNNISYNTITYKRAKYFKRKIKFNINSYSLLTVININSYLLLTVININSYSLLTIISCWFNVTWFCLDTAITVYISTTCIRGPAFLVVPTCVQGPTSFAISNERLASSATFPFTICLIHSTSLWWSLCINTWRWLRLTSMYNISTLA